MAPAKGGTTKHPKHLHGTDEGRAFELRADWTLNQPLPYRIEGQIGRGGLADVYRAVLTDGSDPRPVALKVLRPGTEPDEISRRFQRESQILADLRHPGIAQLLGGGITEDGSPYLVMELIDGETLSTYLSVAQPSLRDRVRLFVELCEIVAYAHRRLVVHRDLKPSNVMVTPDGKPKLLDFGISKLINVETSGLTQDVAGLTPAYASPEQLRGLPPTLATDVYSVGMMLHEALVGSRPYDSREDSRGHGPEAPSRAAARRGDLTLARSLSGDLDAIVDRCLQKDPELRYPSVERLADDLERYLASRPITTRPATVFYRGRKLLARHRYTFGAAFVVLLALAAFFWDREQRRQVLRLERDRAATVNEFLVDIFRYVEPTTPVRANASLRSIVDLGVQRQDQLKDSPQLQAELMGVLGSLYVSLDDEESAEPFLKKSRKILEEIHGDDPHPDLIRAEFRLGLWCQSMNRHGAAQVWLQKALSGARALPNRTLEGQIQTEIGVNHVYLSESEASEHHLNAAASILEEVDRPSELARARLNLAISLRRLGRTNEARSLLEKTLSDLESRTGTDHVLVAEAYHRLGVEIWLSGDFQGGEAPLEKALNIHSRVLGASHEQALNIAVLLFNLKFNLGKLDDAEKLSRRNLEAVSRNPNVSATVAGRVYVSRSRILAREGRLEEAEKAGRQGLAYLIEGLQAFGKLTSWRSEAESQRTRIAFMLLDLDRPQDAEAELAEHFPTSRKTLGAEHEGVRRQHLALLEARLRQGCDPETKRALRSALDQTTLTNFQNIRYRSLLAHCLMERNPVQSAAQLGTLFRESPSFAPDGRGSWREYYWAMAVFAQFVAGRLDGPTAARRLTEHHQKLTAVGPPSGYLRWLDDLHHWIETARAGSVEDR